MHIELGLDTFGDVTKNVAGQGLTMDQVLRNVVAEAVWPIKLASISLV